jgi:hypothetical protein
MLHPFERKIVDFPESPSRGVRGEHTQTNVTSQSVAHLSIDEVRGPEDMVFVVDSFPDKFRLWPITEQLYQYRCIEDRH